MKEGKLVPGMLVVQGSYFLLTGIWPFVHLKSFLWITGPKTDIWLLKTVATLIIAVGFTLLVAGVRREWNIPIFMLAISSALGLMLIDIYHAVSDVIWDVYLLDAVAELALIMAWVIILLRRKKRFVSN